MVSWLTCISGSSGYSRANHAEISWGDQYLDDPAQPVFWGSAFLPLTVSNHRLEDSGRRVVQP